MNKENLKNKELFNCNAESLYTLFESFKYPWEIISNISSYMNELFEHDVEGFEHLSNNILVGKNVEIAKNCEIIGPAIIGDNTKIRQGAYLRGNVIIGQNCVIGNSTEIKNSILLNNVQAPHYNYIGDSLLGNGVHLGAGVICSNLKTDKSIVYIKLQEKINTNLKKLGAILADGVDVGCGCVLNPGTVLCKNTSVYPLNSVRGVYAENLIIKSPQNVVERIIK